MWSRLVPDAKALESDDGNFYRFSAGTRESSASDSDTDADSDSDDMPPKKKTYLVPASSSAASVVSKTPSPDSSEISNAESDTDYSESADDEPDAPAPESPTTEQVKRGLLCSEIRDGIERG